VRYVAEAGMGYLGTQAALRPELSPETASLIDQEVRRLIDAAQEQALGLLHTHLAALHEIARVLQEKEVISGEQIRQITAANPTSMPVANDKVLAGRNGQP
jgi:cell division protease FtsH